MYAVRLEVNSFNDNSWDTSPKLGDANPRSLTDPSQHEHRIASSDNMSCMLTQFGLEGRLEYADCDCRDRVRTGLDLFFIAFRATRGHTKAFVMAKVTDHAETAVRFEAKSDGWAAPQYDSETESDQPSPMP